MTETESQNPTPDNESTQTADVTNSPFSIYSNDSGFRGRYVSRPDTKSNASSSHYRQLKFSLEPDQPLPKNWRRYQTEHGDAYYYNEQTGVTQWEFPVEKPVEETMKRSHESNEDNEKSEMIDDMEPNNIISKELRANVIHESLIG